MRQRGVTELAELVELVVAEVISEAEATRRATATDGAWDDNQVLDTVETVHWRLRRGDLRAARVLASLLMTAVERARPELRRRAALSFVRAATEVVAMDLDGALYRRASDVAERLLPNADTDTLLAIADLKLEPFAVDPIMGAYPQRERARRARLSLLSSGFPEELGMPSPEQPLREAQAIFAALAERLTGAGRGLALVQQAYAAYSLAEAGARIDPETYLTLCANAWPLLDNEPLGTARACWILAKHHAWSRVSTHPMVMQTGAFLMDSYGLRMAAAVSAIGAMLGGGRKRTLVRDLCEELVAALDVESLAVKGFESRQAWFATYRAHVLPHDPTDCTTVAGRPLVALARGRLTGWTNAQIIDATLHSLAHDTTGGGVAFPDLDPDQEALRNWVLAERLERVGRRLRSEKNDTEAVVQFILAAGMHAKNLNQEVAGHCLQLAIACVEASHDAACAAVAELAKWADLLVALLGQAGMCALDQMYRACFCHLHSEGNPLPLGILMQLTKGRAFTRSQAEPGPMRSLPWEASALAEADEASVRLPKPAAMTFVEPTPDLLDEHLFLGAYLLDAEMQDGRDPVEELANRRRVCQQMDIRRLGFEANSTPLLTDQDVREKLPQDAVLVSIYEGPVYGSGETGIVYMLDTAESSMELTVVYRGSLGMRAGDIETRISDSEFTRRIRITPGAARSAHVRRLLLEDPFNRPLSREAESALADQAIAFQQLVDELAKLYRAGKRQLVIWPHGPYYFFPFHLLPLGNGRIVADDWTVVLVPSLQSVVGIRRRRGRESVLAMASPDGGLTYGLAAEPDVILQTRAVAEAFGVEPVQGTIATIDRFLSGAEQVRFVHLAAHGAQYPPAPLFDAIYLADGPLYAHQVLQLDLRGVELVSLSACESQLLRFDLGGNLHGMAAAFLRAGAAAVIGALWAVRATVANTFFSELYSCLAQGQAKFAGFRQAQLITRKKHPQYRDWAAFSIIGDSWER